MSKYKHNTMKTLNVSPVLFCCPLWQSIHRKGNISGALRIAREREELSDWLVAMAPMGMQQIDYLYCRYLYRYNVN
jgi:hypothetical protein